MNIPRISKHVKQSIQPQPSAGLISPSFEVRPIEQVSEFKMPTASLSSLPPVQPVRPPSPTFRRLHNKQAFRSNLLFSENKDDKAGKMEKPISAQSDIDFLLKSEGLARLMDFLISVSNELTLTHLVRRNSYPNNEITSLTNNGEAGSVIAAVLRGLLSILDEMEGWMDVFPPYKQPQRYGNLAFRDWHSHLQTKLPDLLRQFIRNSFGAPLQQLLVDDQDELYLSMSKYLESDEFIMELFAYFQGGFGNATRIDYGSGHELSFVAFMACIDMVASQFIPSSRSNEDQDAAVDQQTTDELRQLRMGWGNVVFARYLSLVRNLLRRYMLEPAGSHGVWGLDDYQFIAYIWGSAQLVNHAHLKPKSFLNLDIVKSYGCSDYSCASNSSPPPSKYMFLGCIAFINEMKTGPFHEHSPMLYDISAVTSWTKVNKGLVKMFIAEVLEKVPIMQHFEFGNLLPWRSATV